MNRSTGGPYAGGPGPAKCCSAAFGASCIRTLRAEIEALSCKRSRQVATIVSFRVRHDRHDNRLKERAHHEPLCHRAGLLPRYPQTLPFSVRPVEKRLAVRQAVRSETGCGAW